jgi:sulfur carrier protein ThiS
MKFMSKSLCPVLHTMTMTVLSFPAQLVAIGVNLSIVPSSLAKYVSSNA